MKVTLDLDKLLAEQKISLQDYHKLQELAAFSMTTLAFNILAGFGVIAVCAAALVLVPSALTAIVLGLCIFLASLGFFNSQWDVLANIGVLLGALLFTGGIIGVDGGTCRSFFAATAIFALIGIGLRSHLLIVLAILALSTTLGAQAGYAFATYFFGINEPFLVIVVFTLLSAGFYASAKKLPPEYQSLAITAAKTSVFMVNMGFWIASLWGEHFPRLGWSLSAGAFAVLWALALVAAGIFAWQQKRRWLLNTACVFGGIHLYTQWFERLGATPLGVLCAGLLALVFAIALRALNKGERK
jgi:iron complex transport system permease protein